MPPKRPALPADPAPDQLWRDPDGQHWMVAEVHGAVATLQRATPAGRVLNPRYRRTFEIERMQAEWQLVSGG